MRKLMGLLALLVVAPAGLAQDEGKGRGEGPSPEELEARRESFYKLCEEKAKEWKGWSAAIRITRTVGTSDSEITREGSVWVRKVAGEEEERELAWQVRPVGNDALYGHVTFKENEILRADVPSKVVDELDAALVDDLFPEMILRDGLRKSLEEHFIVTLVTDARYVKMNPTLKDSKSIDEKVGSQEELDRKQNEWETKEGRKEFKPYGDRADAFHRRKDRIQGHTRKPDDGAGTRKIFQVSLVPRAEKLREAVRSVTVRLAGDTLFPESIQVARSNHRTETILLWEHAAMDPENPYADGMFTIDLSDYRRRRPQKE